MQKLRQRRRLAFLPVILWLTVQFAMTGIWSGPAGAALAALSAGQAEQLVEICGPEGVRVLALDGRGNPVEAPSASNICDWCQAFGSSVLPLPSGADSPEHAFPTRETLWPGAEENLIGKTADRAHRTRAPPFHG